MKPPSEWKHITYLLLLVLLLLVLLLQLVLPDRDEQILLPDILPGRLFLVFNIPTWDETHDGQRGGSGGRCSVDGDVLSMCPEVER